MSSLLDSIRLDGYMDVAVAGLAPDLFRSIREKDAVSLYNTGGLYRRIVDMPVDAALERGLDVSEDMHQELVRLNAYRIVADATKWARLEGYSALVVVSDDGDMTKPLNMKNIGTISGIKPFRGPSVSPTTHTYAASHKLLGGKPEIYSVRDDFSNFDVHESRIIKMTGDTLVGPKLVPWQGASVVHEAYKSANDYFCALGYAMSVLRRKQQGIYRMKGLAEALMMDIEDVAKERVRMVDAIRGVTKTIAVDSEDDYTVRDLSVTGISQLMEEFEVAVSSACGIPVTILFGRTPGGVNSSATSEISTLQGLAGTVRKSIMGPAFHSIMELISAQKHTKIEYTHAEAPWKPLSRPTEMDQASIQKGNSQAYEAYARGLKSLVEAGILTTAEAKIKLEEYETSKKVLTV